MKNIRLIFIVLTLFSHMLNAQNIDIDFNVDSNGDGTKKVTVSYCNNSGIDFDNSEGLDEWNQQLLTLGFRPSSGLIAESPSTQISNFSSGPFVFQDGLLPPAINVISLDQVGGVDDGNVYMNLAVTNSTSYAIGAGECIVAFSFDIPEEVGSEINSEMFLVEDNIPNIIFNTEPNIQNEGSGDNVWSGQSTSGVLPIKLSMFEVRKSLDGKSAILNWSTVSEINGSHFNIERSVNGKYWDLIGTVDAVGESNTTQEYYFEDRNVQSINRSNDRNLFYRLNIVDSDGTQEYSEVRMLKIDFIHNQLLTYPNPAINEIYLELSKTVSTEDPAVVRVFNTNGQKVINQIFTKGNLISMDVSRLTSGTYFIQVEYLNEIYRNTVVINR